jgi:hypothetical protein
MDDCGHIMYYVKGQLRKPNANGRAYVLKSESFFKEVYQWCERCIGPVQYGWYMHTIEKDTYYGKASCVPAYIAISHCETATLLKLAFPDAHIVHSLYDNPN